MNEKYINHAIWLLNALKEHNKILLLEIKNKMQDNLFLGNHNFQQYFYFISIYFKLEKNFEKGFFLLNNKLTKKSLSNLNNIYLVRAAFQFKNSGVYLKKVRREINTSLNLFNIMFLEMKNIASLLNYLESDITYLIKNLY